MSPQTFFYLIIAIFLFETLLGKILWYLNTTRWSEQLPEELSGIYDEKKYAKSQKYEKAKYMFGWVSSIPSFFIMLGVLVFGWFWVLDEILRSYIANPILLTLAFFGVISVLSTIVSLPFSYYGTFVLEEKFW